METTQLVYRFKIVEFGFGSVKVEQNCEIFGLERPARCIIELPEGEFDHYIDWLIGAGVQVTTLCQACEKPYATTRQWGEATEFYDGQPQPHPADEQEADFYEAHCTCGWA